MCTLGWALLHQQEASCIYVNNAEPWNAIKYLGYRELRDCFRLALLLLTTLSNLVLTSFNQSVM